jgi:hypothetical protein
MPFQKTPRSVALRSVLGPLVTVALLILVPVTSVRADEAGAMAGRATASGGGASRTVGPHGRSGRKARRSGARASDDGGGASNFLFRTDSKVVRNQQGKVAVLTFKNDDGYVATQVAQLLDSRGLEVLTTVRPVDTVEQYRDVATSMDLAAFIDGEIKGTEEKMRVIVRLRSGYSGRKVAEVTFTDTHAKMPAQLSSKLWARVGGTLARACVDARKPRKKSRNLLQINAGTAVETVPNMPTRVAQRGD